MYIKDEIAFNLALLFLARDYSSFSSQIFYLNSPCTHFPFLLIFTL